MSQSNGENFVRVVELHRKKDFKKKKARLPYLGLEDRYNLKKLVGLEKVTYGSGKKKKKSKKSSNASTKNNNKKSNGSGKQGSNDAEKDGDKNKNSKGIVESGGENIKNGKERVKMPLPTKDPVTGELILPKVEEKKLSENLPEDIKFGKVKPNIELDDEDTMDEDDDQEEEEDESEGSVSADDSNDEEDEDEIESDADDSENDDEDDDEESEVEEDDDDNDDVESDIIDAIEAGVQEDERLQKEEVELRRRSKQKSSGKKKDEGEENETEEEEKETPLAEVDDPEKAKVEIALICESILQSPEQYIKPGGNKLNALLNAAENSKFGVVRRLSLMSLLAVFKDILPGYKIKVKDDEEDKLDSQGKMLSKEVKQLRTYERELLKSYQSYLKILEGTISRFERYLMRESIEAVDKIKNAANDKKSAHVSAKCLCELHMSKPHFNFRDNILAAIVPRMNSKDPEIAKICCESISKMLSEDLTGDMGLSVVKLVSKLSQRGLVTPACLDAMLSMIITADLKDLSRTIKAKKRRKERKIKRVKEEEDKKNGVKSNLTPGQIKKIEKKIEREKQRVQVARGLREAEGTIDPLQVHAYQSESLRELFIMYLRILKYAVNSSEPQPKKPKKKVEPASPLVKAPITQLVPATLRGVSRYVHLINLEIATSLMESLTHLLQTKQLETGSVFQCSMTILKALQGLGEEMEIDEAPVFSALYDELVKIQSGEYHFKDSEDILALCQCMEMIFIKRQQFVIDRVRMFLRRLCSLAIGVPHAHFALAILSVVRAILHRYKSAQDLLDIEDSVAVHRGIARMIASSSSNNNGNNGNISSILDISTNPVLFASTGKMEVEVNQNDDESIDSGRVLWELVTLANHHHPQVAISARAALAMKPLLPNENYERMIVAYNTLHGGFNPQIRAPKKKSNRSTKDNSESDFDGLTRQKKRRMLRTTISPEYFTPIDKFYKVDEGN